MTLQLDGLAASSQVVAFQCTEALGQLYRLVVGVKTNEPLDLEAVRGLAATFTLPGGESPAVRWCGMVASAALLQAWRDATLYELVIVPKVWATTLTRMSRVFVDMSVREIVETLLLESGLDGDDFAFKPATDHPPREHVCQYRESRWTFMLRLLERAGIYCFFEGADEGKADRLIMVDHAAAHRPMRGASVRYVPLADSDNASASEALHTFVTRHHSIVAGVRTRDFDPLNPRLDVHADAACWERAPGRANYYGEDDFRDPQQGLSRAELRAEQWQAGALVHHARGRVFGIRAGYRFQLSEHPLDSENLEYLAVRVRHSGCAANADARSLALLQWPDEPQLRTGPMPAKGPRLSRGKDYQIELDAIRADRQYRPARSVPEPRIYGVERAFIDGPDDSDYAQLDEHGRYKVKLHFDIDDSDQWDGTASTWIRMLQPHGGVTEGMHFPLRRNTEVMVAFLGGDPDRPVIVGAVPNRVQASPVTDSNHTQNVIQTGGRSRIEIEDEEGCQYIDISTPPADTYLHLGMPHGSHGGYIVAHTGGNQLVTIGGDQETVVRQDRHIDVDGAQHEHIAGDVNERYDSQHLTRVGGARKEDIGGDQRCHVSGARSDYVDGNVFENNGANMTTIISGGHKHSVLGSQEQLVVGSQAITTGTRTDTVAGSLTQEVSGPIRITSAGMEIQTSGEVKQNIGGDWCTVTTGISSGVHLGMKNSLMLGATNAIAAGRYLSLFGGARVSAAASVNINLNYGLSLNITGGAKLDIGSAASIQQAPVTFERSPMWIRAGSATGFVGLVGFRGRLVVL